MSAAFKGGTPGQIRLIKVELILGKPRPGLSTKKCALPLIFAEKTYLCAP